MGLSLFFGCALVAFGFPIVVFLLIVARKAQLVIVFVSSSFAWLLAVTIVALLWFIVPPLQSATWVFLILGVLIQELFRYGFFDFYRKAEQSFSVVGNNAVVFPLSDITSSICE